jgi:hypothetical protein
VLPALLALFPDVVANLADECHADTIMVARTQITLEPEYHRKARARAAELGVSLAAYLRSLVVRDIAGPRSMAGPDRVFDLGTSGTSDIARQKDEYVGEAVNAERSARRISTRRRKR